MTAPYALFIRGSADAIFELSDRLGFDEVMDALAVSVFEDGPGRMFVQALYETETEARVALSSLSLPPETEYTVSQLPDEDWVSLSQAGLPPVHAGRFWVHGSHDKAAIPDDIVHPVLVDAGLAFGTGHHGTTKGCLVIFDQMLSRGEQPLKVLDLGCGAGTLAIAAAMALGRTVLATDIDQDAVDVTLENAQFNDVTDRIEALQADGFDSPALHGRQFDLVFANILAGPLMGLAPDIARSMLPGAHVILSGILDAQAETVSAAFAAEGLSITPQPSIDGWTSLLGVKPAPGL